MNIDVDRNRNLKWCPKPTCSNYVQRTGRFNKIAKCDCGQDVCMNCGGAAHPGVSCSKVGGKELEEWARK